MTFSKTDFLILELMQGFIRSSCPKKSTGEFRKNIEEQYNRMKFEKPEHDEVVTPKQCARRSRNIGRKLIPKSMRSIQG